MSDHRLPRLLARFPETTYDRLLVWYPAHSAIDLVLRYRIAADRLRASFNSNPEDDLLFWPWLYLHRHIAELTMKYAILQSGRIRRKAGDNDPELDPENLKVRLRLKLRHGLDQLADELNRHLAALELDPIDAPTMAMVRDLAEMDPRGESFRYADGRDGHSPPNGHRVDFPALAEAIEGMNDWLGMTLDSLGEADDYYGELASYTD